MAITILLWYVQVALVVQERSYDSQIDLPIGSLACVNVSSLRTRLQAEVLGRV